MKKKRYHSFRRRLMAYFLVASLLPLSVGLATLLQVFRFQLKNDAEQQSGEYLNNALEELDRVCEGFVRVAGDIRDSSLVLRAMTEGGKATEVNSVLFESTDGLREYARFDLYDSEGTWRYSTEDAPAWMHLPTDWGVLGFAVRGEGELVFSACDDGAEADDPLFQGTCLLEDGEGMPAGYLLVSMYQEHFLHLLEGKFGARNELVLLNRYYHPVYCARPSFGEETSLWLRAQLLGQPTEGYSGADYSYTIERHPPTGITLVLCQSPVFPADSMRLLYTVSLISILIGVCISVLMSLRMSGHLSKPINRLHRGIEEVVHNNLDIQVASAWDDELGQLAERFNGMVAALKQNQKELVENQRELDQAQIRMLQAQLNPHFLYNTLDTMKWISKVNQVPQVAVMAADLADILRFAISAEEFVTLRQEVDILERYIEIQKIRLSGIFAFQVNIPEELEDCQMPKMVLQPLVENAVIHGMRGMEEGLIRVEAFQRDGLLWLMVSDNGCGMPPEMIGAYCARNQSPPHSHFGFYNVDTILRKHYGKVFGLYLDSGPDGKGAIVTAILPLRREEESC